MMELDLLAYKLYIDEHYDDTQVISEYFFINEKYVFEWIKKYYNKAKIELRKQKLKRIL